jgi:hypothetical protein
MLEGAAPALRSEARATLSPAADAAQPGKLMIDETHSAARRSWVVSANGHSDFPIQNLPLGVFAPPGGRARGGAPRSACHMGYSCRMFREEPLARPCVSLTEPSNNRPNPLHEGSRDPALTPSGGVLVLTHCLQG